MKGLAVASGKRTITAPDLPTVAEAGVPGYDAVGWFGLVAPAGTPREIVAKLNAETVRIMALPEVRDRALATGAEPATGTSEEFAAFISSEIPKWERVVKASGAKANYAVLFGLFGNRYTADPEVGAALDYLIERIDPRLALVGGCRRTLAQPVQRALEFARSLVVELPAPIALRAQSWSAEPRLRAFFARRATSARFWRAARGARVLRGPARDEAFAILRMTRKQQRVLTQALQGEVIHSDVARTSVSFTEHSVSPPSATVEALRTISSGVRSSSSPSASRSGSQRSTPIGRRFEQERDVLKARMRLAGRGGPRARVRRRTTGRSRRA